MQAGAGVLGSRTTGRHGFDIRAFDLSDGLLTLVLRDVRNNDLGALLSESQRAGATDS
jgi:hypothetical protein